MVDDERRIGDGVGIGVVTREKAAPVEISRRKLSAAIVRHTLGPAWKKDEIRDEKTGYDGVSSGTRGGCRRDKCDEGQ